MRKILTDTIKGSEILARDVLSSSGITIIPAGKSLKKEYIGRLKQLDIDYLYVYDDRSQGVEIEKNIETIVTERYQRKISQKIDNFCFQSQGELEKVSSIAEEIVNEVLNNKEVLYSISGIRRKSEEIYYHCINVSALSVLISIKLQLPKNQIKDIAIGSLLHDIGYIYIPSEMMELKYEDCSHEEKVELKKHVVYGYSMVMKEKWMNKNVKDIILSHHEKIDGSGFPFNKKGEEINIESRIVGLCDYFDSMAYGYLTKKCKVYEIIDYLIKNKAIKFDEKIVNILQSSVAAYPNGTLIVTNNGDLGIVLRQNLKYPRKPIIRLLEDKYGNRYNEWTEKDLHFETYLGIWDTVENEI